MKLFRPRFTMRRLMVAVAIVGILSGMMIFLQRRQSSRKIASDFAFRQRIALEYGKSFPEHSKFTHHDNVVNRSWEITNGNAAYYAMMRAKYERAARYPWLPIEPDPPEPR